MTKASGEKKENMFWFSVKQIPVVILIVVLSIGSSLWYSTALHEVRHIQKDSDGYQDVVCWDFTNNSIAFATSREHLDTTYWTDNHSGVYYEQGFVCALFIVFSIELLVLLIYCKKFKIKM